MATDPVAAGSDRETRPVFLLGAGAQKGGTTWLYQHLARSSQCSPGYAKEASVFDTLDVPEHSWGRDQTFQAAAEDLARLARGEPADFRALHRAAMLADTAVYYDYYTELVVRPGKRFTMDLTPDYALLPTARYAEIRDQFARRGVAVKVVVLLRDPVDRIWSQVRMHLRSRNRRQPDRPHLRSEAELVLERHLRPKVALRTRYEHTLARLDEVFEPADVHVELYERLFSPASTTAIDDFVGIEPLTADFATRVNSSRRRIEALPDDVVSTVAREFEPTYRVVADRLGLDDIAQLWPSARALD